LKKILRENTGKMWFQEERSLSYGWEKSKTQREKSFFIFERAFLSKKNLENFFSIRNFEIQNCEEICFWGKNFEEKFGKLFFKSWKFPKKFFFYVSSNFSLLKRSQKRLTKKIQKYSESFCFNFFQCLLFWKSINLQSVSEYKITTKSKRINRGKKYKQYEMIFW